MCTIPSFPGANSTNAPNSLMLITVPSRTCPASKSVTMMQISFLASSMLAASVPQIDTLPSSVMSIFTPVCSIIALIVLPRCPTTSPIFCGSICIWMIFGANSPTSALGSAIVFLITSSKIYVLAFFVAAIASSMIGLVSL